MWLFGETHSVFVVYDAGNFEGAQPAEAYICWGLPRHLQTQVWGEDRSAWSRSEGEWVMTLDLTYNSNTGELRVRSMTSCSFMCDWSMRFILVAAQTPALQLH